MYTTAAIFIAETPYKSLIFAVFMPRKEKIANTIVSAILNSNVFLILIIIQLQVLYRYFSGK